MSRIGKLPIQLPEGVAIEVKGSKVKVSGPKGIIEKKVPKGISVQVDGIQIKVVANDKADHISALHGTMRAHLANMVKGVTTGWSKTLELVGTGYRAETIGKTLSLSVGYSHPVKVEAPDEITFKVGKSEVTVEGIDKELVGSIASRIREIRPPEPYKGKGIKYKDEVIRRKAGKAAKAASV